jgi:hypothetical protein
MANPDLTKFKKSTTNYLKPTVNNPVLEEKTKVAATQNKKDKKKPSNSGGRPMVEDQPMDKKISINFTANELDKITKKRGMVAVATYLRSIIKSAGVI